MIRRVTVRRFKRFDEQVFDLADAVVLAGPNNSGKSTLLQAISTWKFALDRWREKRTGSKARKRSGVSVTRDRFTPVPLREMNLLWEQRLVMIGSRRPRRIQIEIEGEGVGGGWTCGLEFQYANPELLYVRPLGADHMTPEDFDSFPPPEAAALEVVHVPALSGIAREEPRHERGMQDLLVGSGRPGDILRNLLLEVSQDPGAWKALTVDMRDLFGVALEAPVSAPAQPHITCEYREPGARRSLDISNAGSGTLQVLLILAFFHARRASVVLLDEPDAHQHVVLQKQVYERIRKASAARKGQLIVATHSEVLLDATDPENVVGFFASGPRPLADHRDRTGLQEVLRRITTAELLRARECGAILYVESGSDEYILREWARILNHPAQGFFERANTYRLLGSDQHKARNHFQTLRRQLPDLPGVCLLDRDNKETAEDETQQGLTVLRWDRYEIENYLLHPDAIRRFVGGPLPSLLTVTQEFEYQIPKDADLFGNIPALVRVKASDELLLPLLERAGLRTKKTDLYRLAAVMKPEEIHPEVRRKLDRIASVLLPNQQ